MNYSDILTVSWKRLWQEKVLLLFGLIPILPILLLFSGLTVWALVISEAQLHDFFNSFDQPVPPVGFFVVIGFIFLASIISVLLTPLGWTAIAKGTVDLDTGKSGLTFSSLLSDTMPFFGRAFGILLLIWFGYFFLFGGIMFLMAMFGILTAGLGFLCMLPLMLLIYPLMLVIMAGLFMSIAAVPADDLPFGETLERVWGLLKSNFWPLMLMSFILYMFQMVVGFISTIPMFIGQFLFPFLLSANPSSDLAIFRIFSGFFLIVMILSFLGSAISMTYNQVAWTVTYLNLGRQTPETPK